MAQDHGKTEKPTPRRLRKAREQGQFPRTQDAGTWLAVMAAAAMLPRTAELLTADVRTGFARLATVGTDPAPARALQALGSVPGDVLLTCVPVAGAAVVAAVLGTAAQGVYPTMKGLAPKFARLSPKQGVKRMFGVRSAWEAVKSLVKVLVIGLVVLALARSLMPALLAGSLPLGAVIDRTRGGLQTMLWSVALAGLVMAGQGGSVDANVERWFAQMDPEPGAKKPARSRTTVGAIPVTLCSAEGTYSGGMVGGGASAGKKPGFALTGAIAEGKAGAVFFKLTGPKKTVAAAQKGFDALVKSLKGA